MCKRKRRPLTQAEWKQWRRIQAEIEEEHIDQEMYRKMHGRVVCQDCGTIFTPGSAEELECPWCHEGNLGGGGE